MLADGESGVGAKFYPSDYSKFSRERIFKPMLFAYSDFQRRLSVKSFIKLANEYSHVYSSHAWRLRLWFTEQNMLIQKGIRKALKIVLNL